MTEKLRKELYENAKRCYDLLCDMGVGNYELNHDDRYDELLLLTDELVCGLSGDERSVYWE
jgi:hypothetical protein